MAKRSIRYKHNRLQQLRGFYYAAQNGSISRAAEKMYLSQPSVSLQIQALEREFDAKLFDRNGPKIERTQIWQSIRHPKGILKDGRKVTLDMFHEMLEEEVQKIKEAFGEDVYNNGKYKLARDLFDKIISNDELEEFLTLRAYENLD